MDKCSELQFLKDVAEHGMTALRDDGVHRHIQFRKPGTGIDGFDLITWPGHLCFTGDRGTYVFSRLTDMFMFFRTDREQPRNEQTLFINRGYWAEKLLAIDKHCGVEEYVEDLARARLIEALKEHGGTKAKRREIYDEVTYHLGDGEHEAKNALREYFTDSWEWRLTDYTYGFTWACYAIAWGIQQYDHIDQPAAVSHG